MAKLDDYDDEDPTQSDIARRLHGRSLYGHPIEERPLAFLFLFPFVSPRAFPSEDSSFRLTVHSRGQPGISMGNAFVPMGVPIIDDTSCL